MKTLKVTICKAAEGVSAHLPEVAGYVIGRQTVEQIKKDLPKGLKFHIEGLYEEEKQPWMDEAFDFEYIYNDILSCLERPVRRRLQPTPYRANRKITKT